MNINRSGANLLFTVAAVLGCADVADVEESDDGTDVAQGDESASTTAGAVQAACAGRADWHNNILSRWGIYGRFQDCMDFCEWDSYAYGIRTWVQGRRGSGDDTAVGAIELECRNKWSGGITGTRQSAATYAFPGSKWSYLYTTGNKADPLTGIRVQWEPSQASGDDTALNNLALIRRSGWQDTLAVPAPFTPPNYGSWDVFRFSGEGHTYPNVCPSGTAICGLNTQMEWGGGSGDDTTINGVQFACCTFEPT